KTPESEDTMTQTDDESRRRFLNVSSLSGLGFALSPRTIDEMFASSKAITDEKDDINAETSGTRPERTSGNTAIRPFRFNFLTDELAEWRRRVNATRWTERELVSDASQGVQLATMQRLTRYWGTNYDWRKGEAKLKAVPHFITEIDGLDIHFIHVRSKHEN